MAVVTIHDVPDEVRDKLAGRAALAGQSLQEYLLATLIRLAEKPSGAVLVERMRARKAAMRSALDADAILKLLGEERARD